jgi:hypothetical protein
VLGVRAHPWCGRTWAVPAVHRLALVGCWLGLGRVLGGILPRFCPKVFHYALLKYAFYSAIFCLVLFVFHLIPKMCLAKHVFSNTSENRLIVKAYVSKYAYFSLFGLKLVVINVR